MRLNKLILWYKEEALTNRQGMTKNSSVFEGIKDIIQDPVYIQEKAVKSIKGLSSQKVPPTTYALSMHI